MQTRVHAQCLLNWVKGWILPSTTWIQDCCQVWEKSDGHFWSLRVGVEEGSFSEMSPGQAFLCEFSLLGAAQPAGWHGMAPALPASQLANLSCASLLCAWLPGRHRSVGTAETTGTSTYTGSQVKCSVLYFLPLFSSVKLSPSVFVTPWTAAHQASLSITNSRSPPKPMSIESVMTSNHLILCRPLLLLPSIFPSIRVYSNESALRIRWPKNWNFSFRISPTNEHLGLICFRMDWLDLLAVQGTLKSLLQHHSSKASILRWSAFLIVQLSHPYMTTGKTIALTRRTLVDKVMSLLFNMLSRLVITFLPRSKRLLIS